LLDKPGSGCISNHGSRRFQPRRDSSSSVCKSSYLSGSSLSTFWTLSSFIWRLWQDRW
jgi:hypothetical protein